MSTRSRRRLRHPQFRVWWRPQVPCNAFHVSVSGPDEARKLLSVLAAYDLFQLENRIKPDYCNAGGLEILEHGETEWMEWSDADGNDIDGRPL